MISEFSTSRSDPTRSDLIPRSIYLCSAQASPKPFTSPKVTLPSQAALVVPMRTGRPIRWAFEISRAQASPNWTQEPTSVLSVGYETWNQKAVVCGDMLATPTFKTARNRVFTLPVLVRLKDIPPIQPASV